MTYMHCEIRCDRSQGTSFVNLVRHGVTPRWYGVTPVVIVEVVRHGVARSQVVYRGSIPNEARCCELLGTR